MMGDVVAFRRHAPRARVRLSRSKLDANPKARVEAATLASGNRPHAGDDWKGTPPPAREPRHVWLLLLECGHTTTRGLVRRTGAAFSPPKRAWCDAAGCRFHREPAS